MTSCDRTFYQSYHSRSFFPSHSCRLQLLLSFLENKSFLPRYLHFYSYSGIGTNDYNMKIRMWALVLLTTIRKARNHCQDVYTVGMKTTVSTTSGYTTVRLETTVRIESTVKMEMSMQMIKTSGLP